MNVRPILIVEDNEDDATLTKRSLRKSQVRNPIEHVWDGAEALDYLHRRGAYADRPDINPIVILLDLKLPKVGGLEVLEQIRGNSATRHLPVVILTTSSEQEDRLRSYELGVNSYVRKPIGFGPFADVVAHLGVYWVLVNDPLET